MTGGTAAGLILADLIVEGSNPGPTRSIPSGSRRKRRPRVSSRRTPQSAAVSSAIGSNRCSRRSGPTVRPTFRPATPASFDARASPSASTARRTVRPTPCRRPVRTWAVSSGGTTPRKPGTAPVTARGSLTRGSAVGPCGRGSVVPRAVIKTAKIERCYRRETASRSMRFASGIDSTDSLETAYVPRSAAAPPSSPGSTITPFASSGASIPAATVRGPTAVLERRRGRPSRARSPRAPRVRPRASLRA